MRYLRFVIIPALIAVAVWRLLPYVSDFTKLLELKNNIRPFWIILALISQTGQYIGDGWLSQILLEIVNIKVSFKNTVKIASLAVFAAHLLPMGEAGAFATTFYFYRKLGVSRQRLIFLAAGWSIITNLVLLLIFLVSLALTPQHMAIPFKLSSASLYIVALITLLLLFLLFTRKTILPKIKKLIEKNNWGKETIEFINNLKHYENALISHKMLAFQACIAALIYYATNVATLSFSFLTFGHLPPIPLIAIAYSVSLVAGWITLAPAGIGATEATLVLIFLAFKVDPTQTLATVLVFRLITFWIPIPAGFLSYLSLKREIPKQWHKQP